MRGGQQYRVLLDADEAMRFSFEQGPTFRMGFDDHVQLRKRLAREDLWHRYHTDPTFAARHDDHVEANRRAPPPEWKS